MVLKANVNRLVYVSACYLKCILGVSWVYLVYMYLCVILGLQSILSECGRQCQPPTPAGSNNRINNKFICVVPPTWPPWRQIQTINSNVCELLDHSNRPKLLWYRFHIMPCMCLESSYCGVTKCVKLKSKLPHCSIFWISTHLSIIKFESLLIKTRFPIRSF